VPARHASPGCGQNVSRRMCTPWRWSQSSSKKGPTHCATIPVVPDPHVSRVSDFRRRPGFGPVVAGMAIPTRQPAATDCYGN
jgi:hypothetical protein